MKKLFYFGILFLLLFEIANVYFIMPMPGSQEMNSLDIAYFLYSWRWFFRILLILMILAGSKQAFQSSKWLPATALLIVAVVAFGSNYKMAADSMFLQAVSLKFKDKSTNVVSQDRLVLGLIHKGQAKAYPIQFIGYHHQVRDSLGGLPIMVTYCTVCRTGRVFEPLVNGKTEDFRLVGMDHYNAMFEDKSTRSWWRQATGEAVTGSLKGQKLSEFPSIQTTLDKWIELYPNTLIMQPDENFTAKYENMSKYESGQSKSKLTLRDKGSWQPKSWVIGVIVGTESMAYDWNRLQKERIIYDQIDGRPIAVILAKDNSSFVALERSADDQVFTLSDDTLISGENHYNFIGKSLDNNKPDLKKLNAYQEYWHSWQIFHPRKKKQ